MPNRGSTGKYFSSFIGFFPADEPELCISVVMDEPKVGGYYGGKTAAPVFKRIAERVASYTAILHAGLTRMGVKVVTPQVFDTLLVECDAPAVMGKALAAQANLRKHGDKHVGVSLDETTSRADIQAILTVFAEGKPVADAFAGATAATLIPAAQARTSAYLTHPIFNVHHSETEMLRYIRQLSDKDLALDRSMISLGSCTMKLNATSEMIPITWPEFAQVHPFAPQSQLQGYAQLDQQLTAWLCQATGYAGVSLQPNAGSQGEYAGLLIIHAYHASRGESHRDICLIPSSAHGTNPASAQMAGMKVVVVACDEDGNVDLVDLAKKAEQHSKNLAAIMITYPSTHGVFEQGVQQICDIVHQHGGDIGVPGMSTLHHVVQRLIDDLAPPIGRQGCTARLLDAIERAVPNG